MRRLSINEVKNDIENGYTYMDYIIRYAYGQMTIILNKYSETVLIYFSRDGYRVAYAIPFGQFIKMSRKEFNNRLNHECYYNSILDE